MFNALHSRRSRILSITALAAVLALSARLGAADDEAGDGAVQAEAGSTSRIVMLDQGREPRRVLRFAPKVGSEQVVGMVTSQTTEQEIDGRAIPSQPQPEMRVVMRIGIKPPPAADRIAAEVAYDGLELVNLQEYQEDRRAAIAAYFAQLGGMKMLMVLTPRGELADVRVEVPPGLPPNLQAVAEGFQDNARQMFTPWPIEPVGPGAKWRVEQVIAGKSIEIHQTATYELISREGSTVKLHAAMEQTAEPQRVGDTTRLVSMATSGPADITCDLTKIVPILSVMNVGGTMDFLIGEGDAASKLSTTMTTSIRMEDTGNAAAPDSQEPR